VTDPDAAVRRGSALALVEMERPAGSAAAFERKARYIPRLRQPQPQLEFVIDGTSLQRLLQELEVPEPETYGFPNPFALISVVDFAWPAYRCASPTAPRR
jgi:hypothetical protein